MLLLVSLRALLRDKFRVLVPTWVVVVLHINRGPFASGRLRILGLILCFLGARSSLWDERLVLVPLRIVLEVKANHHRPLAPCLLRARRSAHTVLSARGRAVRRRRISSGVFVSSHALIEWRAAVGVVIVAIGC